MASEYWGKVYTVIDSVRLRRSDGAMVRVTVPLGNSEDVALQAALDLAAKAVAACRNLYPTDRNEIAISCLAINVVADAALAIARQR